MKLAEKNTASWYAAFLCAVIISVGTSTTQAELVSDPAVSKFEYTPPAKTSSIEPIQNLSEPQAVKGSFWIKTPGRAPVLSSKARMTLNRAGQMRNYETRDLNLENPKNSRKDPDVVSEKYLFFRELHHASSNPAQNWRLRVGKGGQIYSVLQNAEVIKNSGEYIGNQGRSLNRWIDRVIQSVVIPEETCNPEFIKEYSHTPMMHQSGCRLDGVLKDFKVQYFNPILSYEYNSSDPLGGSSFNMVQLMFINQRTIPIKGKTGERKTLGKHHPLPYHIQPKALHWTYIRDLGEGVFERVVIIHNFGEFHLERFCNMWSGFVSFEPSWVDTIVGEVSKDFRMVPIMTKPTGEWSPGHDPGVFWYSTTGGWMALVKQAVPGRLPPDWTVKDEGWGLGYVFGDKELNPKDARLSFRPKFGNFDMTIMYTTLYRQIVEPGETLYSNHYFILDDFKGIREKCKKLLPYATYGKIKPYALDGSDHAAGTLSLNRYGSELNYPKLRLWDRPIENGTPVFTIYDTKEKKFLLTDDPYILSARPMDGRTLFVRLNGFARKVSKGDVVPKNQVSLSSRIPASSYKEGDHKDYSLYVTANLAPELMVRDNVNHEEDSHSTPSNPGR